MYVCMCMYIYIHTYIHVYIHTQTCSPRDSPPIRPRTHQLTPFGHLLPLLPLTFAPPTATLALVHQRGQTTTAASTTPGTPTARTSGQVGESGQGRAERRAPQLSVFVLLY